jgi:hypothetical protein
MNPITGLAVTGSGGGNFSFRVDATDYGSTGTDRYAISIYTGSGALYHQAALSWGVNQAVSTNQLNLGGGNIVVHTTP